MDAELERVSEFAIQGRDGYLSRWPRHVTGRRPSASFTAYRTPFHNCRSQARGLSTTFDVWSKRIVARRS